jgi:hypothetical protein
MGMVESEFLKRKYGWDHLVERLLGVYERGIRESSRIGWLIKGEIFNGS